MPDRIRNTRSDGTSNLDDPVPDVSVVVLAHRLTEGLDVCLRSLSSHRSSYKFEVIVVLNGATHDVAEIVDRHPEVTRVFSVSNRGFAGGCNLGASRSEARYLVFLNDDALVQDGWLDGLLHLARTDPELGAIASLVVDPDQRILEFGGRLDQLNPEALERGKNRYRADIFGPRLIDYASGCSLLVERQLFMDLGGFDEGFYPAYFEDADLGLRIWQAGRGVAVTPSSVVVHRESSSTSKAIKEIFFSDARRRFLDKWSDLDKPTPTGLPSPLPRIVYIDDVIPRASSGSGLPRARANLEAITSLGIFVQFVAQDHRRFDLDPLLRAEGIAQISAVNDLSGAPPPVAVVVTRPQNLMTAREVCRHWDDVPLIYDAEARVAARIETQLTLPEFDARRDSLEAELANYLEVERLAANTADVIVAISDDEASWFRAHGDAEVLVLDPFPDRCTPGPAGFSDRSDVVFIAAWMAGSDSPNADAVRWLAREVLPRLIERAPGLSIKITGSAPPRDLLELQTDEFRFVGEARDLGALIDSSRVVIAPIRYGAGVKLKVVDALVRAVPVVASTIGAEGIREPWRRSMVIEDDAERFTDRLIEIASDQTTWERHRRLLLEACALHRGDDAAAWAQVFEVATAKRQGRLHMVQANA